MNTYQYGVRLLFYCSPLHLILSDIVECHSTLCLTHNVTVKSWHLEGLTLKAYDFIDFLTEHICFHLLNEYFSNSFSNGRYLLQYI